MLAMDTTKKLSFTKFIANGDLVIVHERHDATKAVNVTDGSVLQNRFGVLKHSEWIKGIQQQGWICVLIVSDARAMDVGAEPSNPNPLHSRH
ncbi:hypothetical protein MLD38_022704 [Melastoma candidum]|uniref:Uncharacterized protein n=1 Tax=Melastoma candidum TaxID=119954 RepID=A0ACB9QK09_9MYRT|nr:hypothetical protein MLD38_022704 [Melastoma candidum]